MVLEWNFQLHKQQPIILQCSSSFNANKKCEKSSKRICSLQPRYLPIMWPSRICWRCNNSSSNPIGMQTKRINITYHITNSHSNNAKIPDYTVTSPAQIWTKKLSKIYRKQRSSETEFSQGIGGWDNKPKNRDLVMPSDMHVTMAAQKQIQITAMEIKE